MISIFVDTPHKEDKHRNDSLGLFVQATGLS